MLTSGFASLVFVFWSTLTSLLSTETVVKTHVDVTTGQRQFLCSVSENECSLCDSAQKSLICTPGGFELQAATLKGGNDCRGPRAADRFVPRWRPPVSHNVLSSSCFSPVQNEEVHHQIPACRQRHRPPVNQTQPAGFLPYGGRRRRAQRGGESQKTVRISSSESM